MTLVIDGSRLNNCPKEVNELVCCFYGQLLETDRLGEKTNKKRNPRRSKDRNSAEKEDGLGQANLVYCQRDGAERSLTHYACTVGQPTHINGTAEAARLPRIRIGETAICTNPGVMCEN